MDLKEKSREMAANLQARVQAARAANAQRAAQVHAEKNARQRIINEAYQKELLREDVKAARARARMEVREKMKPKQQGFGLFGGSSKPAFSVSVGGGLSGGSSGKRKNLLRV